MLDTAVQHLADQIGGAWVPATMPTADPALIFTGSGGAARRLPFDVGPGMADSREKLVTERWSTP
jgi:hypothetical protein